VKWSHIRHIYNVVERYIYIYIYIYILYNIYIQVDTWRSCWSRILLKSELQSCAA